MSSSSSSSSSSSNEFIRIKIKGEPGTPGGEGKTGPAGPAGPNHLYVNRTAFVDRKFGNDSAPPAAQAIPNPISTYGQIDDEAHPFKTIAAAQKAIEAVSGPRNPTNLWRIFIQPGVYPETVTTTDYIDYDGTNQTTIIAGQIVAEVGPSSFNNLAISFAGSNIKVGANIRFKNVSIDATNPTSKSGLNSVFLIEGTNTQLSLTKSTINAKSSGTGAVRLFELVGGNFNTSSTLFVEGNVFNVTGPFASNLFVHSVSTAGDAGVYFLNNKFTFNLLSAPTPNEEYSVDNYSLPMTNEAEVEDVEDPGKAIPAPIKPNVFYNKNNLYTLLVASPNYAHFNLARASNSMNLDIVYDNCSILIPLNTGINPNLVRSTNSDSRIRLLGVTWVGPKRIPPPAALSKPPYFIEFSQRGTLEVSGGFQAGAKVITGDHLAKDTDYFLYVDSKGMATITLPQPNPTFSNYPIGRTIYIFNASLDKDVNVAYLDKGVPSTVTLGPQTGAVFIFNAFNWSAVISGDGAGKITKDVDSCACLNPGTIIDDIAPKAIKPAKAQMKALSASFNASSYAEWFESGISDKLPFGCSVAIDATTGKIKMAQSTDTPIGVVTASAAVIGNEAEECWWNKYEKSANGLPMFKSQATVPTIMNAQDLVKLANCQGYPEMTIDRLTLGPIKIGDETYVPKLNSTFDSTKQYISRSSRSTWNIVSLTGRVRILNNQVVCANWFKLSKADEVSDWWLIK
jgi:hypothetical protein